MAIETRTEPQLFRRGVFGSLSSGWPIGNRLAALDDAQHFFTALNRQIFRIRVSSCSKRLKIVRRIAFLGPPFEPMHRESDLKNINNVHFLLLRSFPTEQADEDDRAFGVADDFLVPDCLGLEVSSQLVQELSILSSEVSTVAAGRGRVAASDGFGNVIVGLLDSTKDEELKVANCFALKPARLEFGEEGLSGLAFDTQSRPTSDFIACSRFFFKDATVYDRDIAVRTFNTPAGPTAVTFLNDSRVCIAEGNGFSVWDIRAGELGGSTDRKVVGPGKLYTMHIQGELLAVAGVDRVVRIFDIRTMRVLGQWSNCLKYACRSVFIREDKQSCYVAAIDNEASCGQWAVQQHSSRRDGTEPNAVKLPNAPQMVSGALARSPRRLFGFRGDAPWVGVCATSDTLAGISASGSLYLLRTS